MIRPYKFQVVAVCQEVDDDGTVVGEKIVSTSDGQPIQVFGLDGLREFADRFVEKLEQANQPEG